MHQMFVTVSHNLCHHVRKNLHDLNRTYSEKKYAAIPCVCLCVVCAVYVCMCM